MGPYGGAVVSSGRNPRFFLVQKTCMWSMGALGLSLSHWHNENNRQGCTEKLQQVTIVSEARRRQYAAPRVVNAGRI